MTNTSIIIVSDGATSWGADRAELLEQLGDRGWTRDGAFWAEPAEGDSAAAEGGPSPYSELCGAVSIVPGLGPREFPEVDTAGLARFVFRPDLGPGTWEMADGAAEPPCFAEGARVAGGDGEDADAGRVVTATASHAYVAWDGGFRTWTPAEDLAAE